MGKMNKEQFIGCVQSTIKNPPFPIHINYEDVDTYVYEKMISSKKVIYKR